MILSSLFSVENNWSAPNISHAMTSTLDCLQMSSSKLIRPLSYISVSGIVPGQEQNAEKIFCWILTQMVRGPTVNTDFVLNWNFLWFLRAYVSCMANISQTVTTWPCTTTVKHVTLCCWPVSSLLHQQRSKLPKPHPAQWPRPRQYWLQVPAVLCFPQPVSHPGQTSPAEAPWAQQGPEHRRVVCHGVPYGGFPWCFLLCNGSCSALRNKRIQVRDVSQWHNCLPGSEKSWVWFPVLSKINKRVLLVSSLSTSYCLTQRIHFLPQKC